MPFRDLSPKLQGIVNKRIEKQKRFKKDANGGTVPFKFVLPGTGKPMKGVKAPQVVLTKQEAILPDMVKIFDPYDDKRKEKTLRNVVSQSSKYDARTETYVPSEILGEIEFSGGECYVQIDELDKLAILMFGHGNLSKPESMKMKGATSPVYWEEDKGSLYVSDYRNEVNDAQLLMLALQEAMRCDLERKKAVLLKVSEKKELEAMNPLGKQSDVIDNDFFFFVKKEPKEFLFTHSDERTRLKVKLFDAKFRGLLKHDEGAGRFILADHKATPFFQYVKVSTADPEEALLNHLSSTSDKKIAEKLMILDHYLKPLPHPYLPEEKPEELKEMEATAEA